MNKILVSLALSLICLTDSSAMAASPTFSTQKMAQTKLFDLSFKQVMREFYNGQMTDALVQNEDIESMPYIGLGYPKEGQQTIAIMHPVVHYENIADESRYLVVIEKVIVDANTNQLQACHACNATADIYSFKQLDDGGFQLVSKKHPDAILPNNYGRIQFDSKSFLKGLQPLGTNLIGSLFTTDDYFSGATYNYWEALHLPEDDYINSITVGDAGSDFGGMYEQDSPLYYKYDVGLRVVYDDSKYYPILLDLYGDMPFERDYKRIEPVNSIVGMQYDSAKREYKPFDSLPIKVYNAKYGKNKAVNSLNYSYDLLSPRDQTIALNIDVIEARVELALATAELERVIIEGERVNY